MTSTKIPIPIYDPTQSYELYKEELELWNSVTDMPAAKRAGCVMLTLPRTAECTLRTTVMQKIDKTKINKSGGFKVLTDCLDSILGKDKLQDCVDKYDEFEDYHRTKETIREYIQTFDTNYNKLINLNITLPQEVLALKIIRNAKISAGDKKLVLTGINMDEKDKLYEQAKSALRKYCGEGFSVVNRESEGSVSVKYEPIKSEALVTGAYGRGRSNYRGNSGGNSGGRGRGFWPHQQVKPTSSNWRGGSTARSWRGGAQASGSERPLNPPGLDGKPMLCKGCGSYRHFLQTCPESWENMNKVSSVNNAEQVGAEYMPTREDIWEGEHSECYYDQQYYDECQYDPYVTLFTDSDPIALSKFTVEAQNCAVLDTACASTVCGLQWFDEYVQQNHDSSVTLIKPEGSCSFKFGAGPVITSLGTYEIPITLAGVNVKLVTDVVNSDIPLLLSKNSMKKAGIMIDMNTDTARIFGKTVPLDTTSSGHYCVPISVEYSVEEVAEVMSTRKTESQPSSTESQPSKTELKSNLMKIHRQFGHPSQVKLKALLTDANQWNEEHKVALDEVYSQCESRGMCRFKDKILRPVAALPMASDFNEKIAMDLKSWKGKWILHIVDLWSRFTMSTFISRKKPTDVIHGLMNEWCSVFGVPSGILTDNGGEFVNEELDEVRSMFNIEPFSTAANSPFQNGTCERNHQVVDSILEKLVNEFPKTPESVLLKWACMAKNTLQMYEGFSSHQLVFGRNPHLPNILTSTPSSLEYTTISERFTEHLNGLHAARKAFIESEACIRIKRALKHKIRTNETVFNPGETVYYKRDRCDRWMGPAKVIFQDGKVVFIRHGAVWVKASPNRIVKSGKEFQESSEAINTCKDPAQSVDLDEENFDTILPGTHAEVTPHVTHTEERTEEQTSTRTEEQTSTRTEEQTVIQPEEQTSTRTEEQTATQPEEQTSTHMEQQTEQVTEELTEQVTATGSREQKTHTKKKNKEYKEPERRSQRKFNEETGYYVYYSRTPATPSYEWEIYMTDVPKELLKSPEVREAKQEELKKLDMFDVYEEVDHKGQCLIDTKWVVTYKGQGIKARIVARGFQEREFVVSDSPTVAKTAFRTVLSIAASNKWCISTTDIKSAFLQGNYIERDVYLKPPKEAEVTEGKVWKLKKSLYGLYDGARQFYLSVRETLISLGCHICSVDPSLFFILMVITA